MFRSKLRPGQFEFPSCDLCNQETKTADQFAALVGRCMPDPTTPEEKAEFRKLLSEVKNNIAPALEEMNLAGPKEEQMMKTRTPAYLDVPVGFVNLAGANTQRLLNIFGCKLALAMHWEATKQFVPLGGGVVLRVFSNVDAMEGKLPTPLLHLLPPELQTLQQGKWNVRDQFEYAMRVTDDRLTGCFFASFRSSFAMTAVTTNDRSSLPKTTWNVFAPAELWGARRA
jgi:hypothetical protein